MLSSFSPAYYTFDDDLLRDALSYEHMTFDKIYTYITDSKDVFKDITHEGFLEMLRIARVAYKFERIQPEPSLADKMAMIINDEAKAIKGTRMYYFLNAMTLCMLRDSMEKREELKQDLKTLDTKIDDVLTRFKALPSV